MSKQYARQKLLDHVKKWEKMRSRPYLDVDGNYAIGYGSHFVGGKPVTKDTRAIDETAATAELTAYLTERENTLAKFIPNWGKIPSDRQDMLLDVAMGKKGILSAKSSPNLHRRLGATTDPAELSRIVDEEYPTYSKAGGVDNEGLANRRADGLNTLRVQQDAKGGKTHADIEGGDVRRTTYEDLRKLADTSYKGDMKAAVYSLDPKVVTATVDSFGGNIDRTNRPMYIHRDKNGKITGYSTTNSGDALDKGVKPEGRFQSVLVPFVRQGKDGPEYTEDYKVAQRWYDESGQHYGKFDMDFTTPEAKARSIDRFNAASWLVHREQQLRYQSEFDKIVEAERHQAAKAGDAGSSKSSAVPTGHNAALDGYSGPRIIVNPSTFKNEKDALCVAYDEAFRIVMEEMQFDPVSEPTDRQREFFSDTAYANDENMLRRTILARICTFDTSVEDPTDEQIQEAVEFLESVLEAGFTQNEDEQSKVQRILDVLRSVPERAEPAEPAEPTEPTEPTASTQAATYGGETEDDERKDLGADVKVPTADDDVKGAPVEKLGAPDRTDPTRTAPAGGNYNPDRSDSAAAAVLTAGGAMLQDPRRDAEGPEYVTRKDESVFLW